MKTKTVTVREGEYLGPVDWNYNFLSHFDTYCTNDQTKKEYCEKAKAVLKELEGNKDKYLVTTDGGWPRFGWFKVFLVGMYDGWPYWRPVPSVLMDGVLGSEWHSFNDITEIRKIE